MTARDGSQAPGLKTLGRRSQSERLRPKAWRSAALAALALGLLSLLLVYDHTRNDSLSADEPVHILSGYFEVFAHNAIVNIEHPPLMKILAGLGLARLSLPRPPQRVPMGNRFSDYGHEFLFAGPVPPDTIVAAARAPFLLVLAGLLAAVFFEARSRYGDAPRYSPSRSSPSTPMSSKIPLFMPPAKAVP